MWKPMLPKLVQDAPEGKDWVYEVKYDGYRCGLQWEKENIYLWSRNGNDLAAFFPEIIIWCKAHQEQVENHLPLFLDGELVILNTWCQANFSLLKKRCGLKSKEHREALSKLRPATLMVFDLLQIKGENILEISYLDRRKKLSSLFAQNKWAAFNFLERLNLIQNNCNLHEIWNNVFLHHGEGIIAKNLNGKYLAGKRTDQWQKIKNWRKCTGILTKWNAENDYYDVSVYDRGSLKLLGKVKHGFSPEEKSALTQLIQDKGKKISSKTWHIPAGICIDFYCLDAKNGELREPVFKNFRFDLEPSSCTLKEVTKDLAQLPPEITISNPEKLIFPHFNKEALVLYLRHVAPYILPKLKDKRLTLIRYPDGINRHFFYQKNLPNYAPDFIKRVAGDSPGEMNFLCNDLKSLLWFGNHGAVEYHIPFQKYYSDFPDEIVFDLDPPSLEYFHLAVFAARLIREICENKGYKVYPKTSGRKGLQLHLPLKESCMSFNKTRIFIEAVARVLTNTYPELFTIERLKKNRGNKLYIDFLQHAPGKTIIAPYSPRATQEATVATPLFWEEVKEDLDPTKFTIETVPIRLQERGCPYNLEN